MEKIAHVGEDDTITFSCHKNQPIQGIDNEKALVSDVFESLRSCASYSKHGITEFFQIKEATLKALNDLFMAW